MAIVLVAPEATAVAFAVQGGCGGGRLCPAQEAHNYRICEAHSLLDNAVVIGPRAAATTTIHSSSSIKI